MSSWPALTGTASQIEWALLIRVQVEAEFTRVARAFSGVAGGQSEPGLAILAVLEEIRKEVMARDSAGYFIKDWQELDGRVRRLIFDDPRYKLIRPDRVR